MTHEERIELAILSRLDGGLSDGSSRVPLRDLVSSVHESLGASDVLRQCFRMLLSRPRQVPDIFFGLVERDMVHLDPRPGRGVAILDAGRRRLDRLREAA